MCVCMREGGGYDPNHNFKSKMFRVFPFQALGYYSVVSVKIEHITQSRGYYELLLPVSYFN